MNKHFVFLFKVYSYVSVFLHVWYWIKTFYSKKLFHFNVNAQRNKQAKLSNESQYNCKISTLYKANVKVGVLYIEVRLKLKRYVFI